MNHNPSSVGAHHPGGLPAPSPTGQRLEGVVQVLIMLAVAAMAGAASFRHVHDWTMHTSPPGTGDWFGWANAMVSELIPLAAGLEARRRRRRFGTAGAYPIALILGAVALSLTGQFAEAKPGLSGWVISAVPAIGFLALVKLVLSGPTTLVPETVTPPVVPTSTPTTAPVSDSAPVVETPSVEVPTHLIPTVRFAITQHEQATGRPITVDELAARLSLSPAVAGQLLATLTPATTPINGTPLAVRQS
jgi:hypothetical protein